MGRLTLLGIRGLGRGAKLRPTIRPVFRLFYAPFRSRPNTTCLTRTWIDVLFLSDKVREDTLSISEIYRLP